MWEAGGSESSTCYRTTGAAAVRPTVLRSGWSAASEGGLVAQALVPADLHRRWEAARARSARSQERAAELVAAATLNRTRAEKVRLRSMALRGADDAPARSLVGFRIDGTVEDQPCVATFVDGTLSCSPSLLHRADIGVAMCETFWDGCGRWVTASLDGPVVAVLVTLMRACSRISSIEMCTSRGVS